MPVIPTSQCNHLLIKALHHELREKDFVNNEQSTKRAAEKKIVNDSEGRLNQSSEMPQKILDGTEGDNKWKTVDSDSSGGGDTDASDDNDDSDQSEESNSSFEHEPAFVVERKQRMWLNNETDGQESDKKKKSSQMLKNHNQALKKNNHATKTKKMELTDREKQQIKEGYERHVINGERPPTGTSFGAKLSAFQKRSGEASRKVENNEADDIVFPLERAAAGETDEIGLKDVMKIERATKRKTKIEKQAIAEAKLSVSEAKLTEFEAKLRARQARIDERHAKLCYRRAIIKRAEERLQTLESRLDDEEEIHRERERRVKNRERRVRQEEAGIQIKEVSLKRRETKITEDLKDIERRKKLVEEKEEMSKTMEDIMTKQENLHQEQAEKKSKFNTVAPFMRRLRKPAYKSGNTAFGTVQEKKQSLSTSEKSYKTENKPSSGTNTPVSSPRKAAAKRGVSSKVKKRSNSLNSMHSDEISSTELDNNKNKADKRHSSFFPESKDENAIMGLWL